MSFELSTFIKFYKQIRTNSFIIHCLNCWEFIQSRVDLKKKLKKCVRSIEIRSFSNRGFCELVKGSPIIISWLNSFQKASITNNGLAFTNLIDNFLIYLSSLQHLLNCTFLRKFYVLRFLWRFYLFLWRSIFRFESLISNNRNSINWGNLFNRFRLLKIFLHSLLVDRLLSHLQFT